MAIALTKLNEAGILMEIHQSLAQPSPKVNAPLSILTVVSLAQDSLPEMDKPA